MLETDSCVVSAPKDIVMGEKFFTIQALSLEVVRRSTFKKWPVTFIDPNDLAKNGFFYTKVSDHVQCAFCGGVIGLWEVDDTPESEHRRHFPTCPFVLNHTTPNVPYGEENPLSELLSKAYNYIVDNGSNIDNSYPHMQNYTNRLKSFIKWPKSIDVDRVDMAKANLFYSENGDLTFCYKCGGGIYNWVDTASPEIVHDKLYPDCGKYDKVVTPLTIQPEESTLLMQHPIAIVSIK